MNEKTGTCVSSEKEKVKESQSQSVTPLLDTPSGAGWGGVTRLLSNYLQAFLFFSSLLKNMTYKKKLMLRVSQQSSREQNYRATFMVAKYADELLPSATYCSPLKLRNVGKNGFEHNNLAIFELKLY